MKEKCVENDTLLALRNVLGFRFKVVSYDSMAPWYRGWRVDICIGSRKFEFLSVPNGKWLCCRIGDTRKDAEDSLAQDLSCGGTKVRDAETQKTLFVLPSFSSEEELRMKVRISA